MTSILFKTNNSSTSKKMMHWNKCKPKGRQLCRRSSLIISSSRKMRIRMEKSIFINNRTIITWCTRMSMEMKSLSSRSSCNRMKTMLSRMLYSLIILRTILFKANTNSNQTTSITDSITTNMENTNSFKRLMRLLMKTMNSSSLTKNSQRKSWSNCRSRLWK